LEIDRRDFIKLLGGVTGSITLAAYGCNNFIDVPEKLIELAKKGPKIETWKNTICGQCPAGCGIRVRLIDGIPVYIKGNPIYPVNQGGMCPYGHSALEVLFNPDRVKQPLKRKGLKGGGKWEKISWNDALKKISSTLNKLRNSGNPHKVAFLDCSSKKGLMNKHISQFMKSYGSPNYFKFPSVKNNVVPYNLLQGINKIPSYDLLNSNYILSIGSNFLEDGYSPIYYTKLYSHFREYTKAKHTKLVQIESRMSLTAANADLWIPIKPGTYGAFALGIAYVIIREELYDKDFVKRHVFGFEDWVDKKGKTHLGFKSNVLSNYYPEEVSKITKVPARTILEVARELGNNKPSIVLGNECVYENTNGTFAQMAVYSLNALLGNFEKKGGVFFVDEPPFKKLPSIRYDSAAKKGNKTKPVNASNEFKYPLTDFSFESFTKNIIDENPYPIEVLFIYGGNPLFNTLDYHNFAEALKKIPMVVSFDSFVSETSGYADIILPDNTSLEKWDEFSNVPSVGFTHVGIQQPIIKPLYNTRNSADVILDLSKRIKGPTSKALPFKNYEEEIKYTVENLYKSGKGSIISKGSQSSWIDFLQQRGWQIGRYNSFEDFWKLLIQNGGWWNPKRKGKNYRTLFKTKTGKFELYSTELEKTINKLIIDSGGDTPENREKVLHNLKISVRGDKIYLPHHENVNINENFPMHLVTYTLLTNRNGQASNQPLMQEMFGYTVREYWRTWAEINPRTAKEYGIKEDDFIWVESTIGSLKLKAKLNPGIMLDVVAVPFGLGHTNFGRYANGYGENPLRIMNNRYDSINGIQALQSTKVKIYPAI